MSGAVKVLHNKTLPFVVVWAIFFAYLLAARGVRNFFPISAFDMYQGKSPTTASRVLVLDATGQTSEMTSYEAFQCDPPRPNLADVDHCDYAGFGRIDYVTQDLQIHLDAHLQPSVSGGHEVKLVWRKFTLEERPGPPTFADCPLAVCLARRKGGKP